MAIVVVNFIYLCLYCCECFFFYIDSYRYAGIIEAVNGLSNLYNVPTAATLKEASAMKPLIDAQLAIEFDWKVTDENWFIKEVSSF